MAVAVSVSVSRPLALRLAPDAALAFLADIPAWAALFPHVARIEPLAAPELATDSLAADSLAADSLGAFRWTMGPLGPPGAAVETVYACRYTRDAAARTLAWTPVDGVGNARFSGSVALRPGEAGGTVGRLTLDAVLTVPAPAFVRALVVLAVRAEFERMVGTFAARLAALEP